MGRNALFLLNVPPDTRGRIHEADSLRLMEFRDWRDRVFGADLADGARIRKRSRSWELTLPEERCIDLVQLQEDISLGQRISSFRVDVWADDGWQLVADGTTIGYKRILPIDPVCTRRLRVTITGSLAPPHLSGVALYKR